MTEHNGFKNKKVTNDLDHQDDDFNLDDYLEGQMQTGSARPGVTIKQPKKESHTFRNLIIGGAIIAGAVYFTNPVERVQDFFGGGAAGDEIAATVDGGAAPIGIQTTPAPTPVEIIFGQNSDLPSGVTEELLQGMGQWMADMGYGNLSREELLSLRADGITATRTQAFHDMGYTNLSLQDLRDLGRADVRPGFISGFNDLGYTNLTVDQMISLEKSDVNSTFASMMQGLGYELSIEDMALLRRSGVTAFYTSNMHDLGYTDLTQEQLIRMRTIGVTTDLVKQMIADRNGDRPTYQEIIRHRISNQ